jgi:hypothetical protein
VGGADGGSVRFSLISRGLVPGPAPASSLRFVLGAEPAFTLALRDPGLVMSPSFAKSAKIMRIHA